MPTKLSEIDPGAIEWEAGPDINVISEDQVQWDLKPETAGVEDQPGQVTQIPKFDAGTGDQAEAYDPDDIWSDPSFTGQKPPVDEGPSFIQKYLPAFTTTMGGPIAESLFHAAAGTEPYRPADADPGAFEPVKALVEGHKGLARATGRAIEMLTRDQTDTPDVTQYDLEDPIDRSKYYVDMMKSDYEGSTNAVLNPIAEKIAELERLQPDTEYYNRLSTKPKFTKYMEEVVGMASQMASQVAAFMTTGGVSSGIWMAMQIASSEYDGLIAEGVDPERARTAAWGSSMSQAPLEMLSLGFMLNNPITRKLIKGALLKFGLDRVMGGATEWITETVQQVPSKFWENWAQDPDYIAKLQENPELINTLVSQGLREGVPQGNVAAFYGAILGGTGAPRVPKARKDPVAGEKIDPAVEEVLQGLSDDFKAGVLTAEDVESMRKNIDPSHPLYTRLGELAGIPAETPAGEPTEVPGAERAIAGERLPALEKLISESLEEGAEVEAVRVDPEKKNVHSVVKIAKALGLDITVYKGKGKIDGLNGLVDTETGQIYLNETASDPYITVLGHESLHRLKRDHSDLYDTLVGKVKELDIDITDYLDTANKARKVAGVAEMTADEALSTEEFIADFVGQQFTKKDFWQKLNKENPTLGKQLAQIVKDLVEAIKTAMRKGKSIDAAFFKQMNDAQDALAGVYGEFARRETQVTDKTIEKPAEVKKPMTAEQKAARAAEMPLQVEFDHIVKGLSTDAKKAAADIIADTETPIKERLAIIKSIASGRGIPKPAKGDRREKARPGAAERRQEGLETREPPAWDKEFRKIYVNAKNMDEAKFIEAGKALLEKRPAGLMDLAKRMGTTIEADTDLDEALKTIHARILAGMQPRKKASEMTEDELREASNTDYLTGLRNKQAFDLEDTRKAHVSSIDLDSLKYINDNFGHQAGDAMLINFGNALKTITEADTYHVSGDEFIVQSDDAAQLEELLNKRVVEFLNKNPLTVITADGQKIQYEVQFSHGTAKTVTKAEERLHTDKAQREAAGKRAGRGEIPPGISKGLAEGQRTGDQRETVPEKVTPEQEYDALVGGLTAAQKKDKAIKNVVGDTTSAVSQRLGILKNAIAAYDKKNPPKIKKRSTAGANVRTFRGAILAAGGIKWGDQFKGERKTMAENSPGAMYLTRQKTGMPWDTLEQQLKDDGWLGPDEVLLDVLNDPSVLKRGRVAGDLMEKKADHLTEQEKEAKAEIIHEAEEPPPGDYQTMEAEDLPMGKKLTLIEGESTRGWDVYEVIEKDPFGVTLKDGMTIELSPNDKVQVRRQDLAASVKSLTKPKEKHRIKDRKKLKQEITDEDLEISDTEKAKFSPKFKKPGQMELPIFKGQQFEFDFGDKGITVKHEKPEAKPVASKATKPKAKKKPDKFDVQARAQKVRMATTGWLGSAGRVVRNLDEAASLLAPIRKSAQEQLYVVATDANGLVLEIHKYSKGIKSSAPFQGNEAVGRLLNTEGAKTAYFIHNHPSTSITASPEDISTFKYLNEATSIAGIKVSGLVISGTSYVDLQTGASKKIQPISRTMKLPVKERYLNRLAGFKAISSVNNSALARDYLASVHNNAEGFLFLDGGLKPVGFVPMQPTNTKELTTALIKTAEDLNASGYLFNSTQRIDSVPGRSEFLRSFTRQFGDTLQLFEILEEGISHADAGTLSKYKQASKGVSPGLAKLGTKDPVFSVKAREQALFSIKTKRRWHEPIKKYVAYTRDNPEATRDEIQTATGLSEYQVENLQELEKSQAYQQALFSVKSPGFYSKMEKTLEAKLQGKGTPAQYQATIDALVKKGAFKSEELEWSGLDEWLADQGAAKIKKQAVMNWLQANNLEVREVSYKSRQSSDDTMQEGYINWPQEVGTADEYEATWTNPLDPKEYKFEAEKAKDDTWTLFIEGSPEIKDVFGSAMFFKDEQTMRNFASDYANDLFEDSIDEAAKIDWIEVEGGKGSTWNGTNRNPITGEMGNWKIEKEGEDVGSVYYVITQDGDHWDDTTGSLPEAKNYIEQRLADAIREEIDMGGGMDYAEPSKDEPRHDTWQLPMGKNYQELLLTLPPDIKAERAARDKRLKELIVNKEALEKDLDKADESVSLKHVQTLKREIGNLKRQIDMVMRESDTEATRTAFRGAHWEEPNVVAHVRFNDRTDAEGRKVLFIEEIQSDWHQAGRKIGYIGGETVFRIKYANGDVYNTFDTKKQAEDVTKKLNADESWGKLQGGFHVVKEIENQKGVPDAPFKKTWPMLAFKRMVRYAAEGGYDTISWTPGEVQTERYDLSEQVYEVQWHSDTKQFMAWKNKDDVEPAISKGDVTEKNLEDYVGKEIAQRLIDKRDAGDATPVLNGLDLKVGGEPMRVFYDEKVKNMVNNFFNKKAWGYSHVESGHTVVNKNISEEITSKLLSAASRKAHKEGDHAASRWLSDQARGLEVGKGYSMAVFNPNPWPGADKPPSYYVDAVRKAEDKYQQMWTLPITTQMRDKAMGEGMPLFSVKRATNAPTAVDLSTADYRVVFSPKIDHPGYEQAEIFNTANPGNDIKFDGEWDRSAIDMDPMYQFTAREGDATGVTFTTETLDTEEISTKFYKLATPFIENKAAMSVKDRIDPITQTYIDALQAAQPDAFFTSPDIDSDPTTGLPKEVATALEASKGLGRLSFFEKFGDTLKDIWHSSTRHRPYLDPKEYSDIANVLRIYQEVPSNSARRAGQALSAIMGNLKPNQYKVFAHKLLMDDMAKDVESGLLKDPNNLPFGFNIKTAREYLARLNKIAERDPVIADALERRTLFNNKLKRALVDAKLLPESVMEDERYFHHQVLQYRAVREIGSDYYPGIGVSSKDVRLKKKGWQRGRIGSSKDYNSDYAESEFEVIAQAISQLDTKYTMGRIQDLADIMPALKTQAKSMNLHQLYVNEAERLTAQGTSGKKWTAAMVQEEADPLSPFKAEVAKGLSWIGNMAKKGKLENGSRDFTDVIEALEEWQREVLDEKARAKDDMRDPVPIPFPFDELGSRAWAYFNHMMSENLEGAPAAGIIFRAIRQRNEFIKEYLGRDFKKPTDIMPDDHVIWKPAPGTSWYKAYSLSDRIVDAVQAGEMVIGEENADKIKQILARGRDVEWIVPTDVAKTLDGYDVKLEDHMISVASRKMMTGWKQWILINPYRVIKYNVNNMSGDLDIALAYDPKIVFKYMAGATRDVYKDWKRKKISPELQKEIDLAHSLGVVGSGWSVQEVADVTRELAYDKHMQAITGEKPNLIKQGWRGLQGFTNYRENILRLAAFRYFQDRIAAGDKNIYAASNKAEIDGIKDNTEKAAKLARELIGDYGNITHSGQWLRRHLIPFYCVPEDTEILTREGWKRHESLNTGEKVLTYNLKTRCTEWQKVQNKAVFPFDDELITIKNKWGFKYQFTEDHRMVVIEKYKDQRKIVLAKDLKSHQHLPIVAPHDFVEKSILNETESSLLGWLVTDGYFRTRKYSPNSFEAMLYQKKPDRVEMIREKFSDYISSESVHPETGVICFRLKAGELGAIRNVFKLKDDLPAIVTRLGEKECQAMYEAMISAEGTKVNGFVAFTQNEGPVLDAFQILCYILGKAGHIRPKKANGKFSKIEDHKSIYVKKRDRVQLFKWEIGRECYKGQVWCPKTPNGTWVMRQDGKVMITGNSWLEVNAPRYVRLMRNLKHEGQGARKIGRALPLVGANVAWKGSKLAAKATAIYVLANVWNRTFFPDEDDELGEAQRRQLHIIFGRREDGSVVSLRFQGALSDALAWFGGEDLHKDIADVISKKATFGEKVKEAALAPIIKIISGIRPDIKAGAETLSGTSFWPDPFNPRPIYDKLEHVTRLFSLNGAYGWLVGKPKRGDTTGERLLNDLMALGFYNSDPGESAYYDIKSKTFDYLRKTGMERPSISPTNKSKALYYYKQSLKYGDLKAAEKYLGKYYKLGGTSTGITSSLRRSAPLGSLAKKDHRKFLATLNEDEKERYQLALRWYRDTYQKRRQKVSIPPRGGQPAVDRDQPGGGNSLREIYKLLNE